jgi:L-malate glycosyltransferase
MRVLLVISSLGVAGAENQLVHLAIGLARAGHEVTIVALRLVCRDLAPLREAGVRVISLGRPRQATRPLVLPRLVRLARRADVVHCTSWDASLWGRLAAVAAGRPALVTEHTPYREMQVSATGAPRERWIALHNRLLGRVTYAIVAVGRSQIPVLHGDGVRADSIAYIPNAVPVEEVRAASRDGVGRHELGIPPDALVVTQVSRFVIQKNHALTYEVVRRLREELGEVHALFVGDGKEREALESRARRDGAAWAHFLGHRTDIPRLLALTDVTVLPSSAEGMPLVLLEALAVGTPVVATDVGDVRLLLESTGAGLCLPPGDPDAFLDACRSVLADEGVRRRLVEAAKANAAAFDGPVMTRRYAKLFAAAIDGRPVPAELRPSSDDGTPRA